MTESKVLVVEDDPDIQELVQYNLERQGFQVVTCSDGESGLDEASRLPYGVMVLDIMLPGMDGLSILRKLKENPSTRSIPIIMLTAKGEESDIVIGLELGADDYVVKPFSPKELVARIRSVIRRSEQGRVPPSGENIIEAGPIVIDRGQHVVYHRSKELPVTLSEFRIIECLAASCGRVYTRDQLLNSIAGEDTCLVDRNIDVHIRSLRKKLGSDSDFIVTVRGVGYKCRG